MGKLVRCNITLAKVLLLLQNAADFVVQDGRSRAVDGGTGGGIPSKFAWELAVVVALLMVFVVLVACALRKTLRSKNGES